ncbi:N-acetylmuramoyl-L-alanine amidase family protein [Pseudomonas sp. CLCA07]
MHRRHSLSLILASAAFALPFGVSATQIRNARLWRSDDKLRLVFDLKTAAPLPIVVASEAIQETMHPKRDIIVVVDPGRGGKDPGAVGAKGEREKDVLLSIAQLLAKRLKREKGFDVKLVRNDDFFVPLRKRVEIAHKHNADMFISVHADAAPRLTASGASVYCLSEGGATSATARFMAQRENGADLLGVTRLLNLNLKDKDPMLAGVILDMSMNATLAAILQLGSTVLGSLAGITTLHQKRVEQAGFAVLKSPDMPSILVETGFISNARDSQRLVTARHQQAVADGLFEGLQRYFQKNPPANSYIAWQQEQKKAQV